MQTYTVSPDVHALFLLAALRALLSACGVPSHRLASVAAKVAHLIASEVQR